MRAVWRFARSIDTLVSIAADRPGVVGIDLAGAPPRMFGPWQTIKRFFVEPSSSDWA